MVVLALLQGLAEALTQGQVTLSGGAVQKLPDLVGAGPQLQGLGASACGSLACGTEAAKSAPGWHPEVGSKAGGCRPLPTPPVQVPLGPVAG